MILLQINKNMFLFRKDVIQIAKTELTKKLEQDIWKETNKRGVFGCFEVTIGWYGKERVDYMTYDTNGIWRCYEIKVSKADFYSKAKKTFIGHFNYYVITNELYEQVKDEIPNYIGVYCGKVLKKRPKKQELKVDEQILKNSMIRSLSRENQKFIKTKDNEFINKLNSKINRLEKECQNNYNRYLKFSNSLYPVCEKYNLNHKEVRDFIRDLED